MVFSLIALGVDECGFELDRAFVALLAAVDDLETLPLDCALGEGLGTLSTAVRGVPGGEQIVACASDVISSEAGAHELHDGLGFLLVQQIRLAAFVEGLAGATGAQGFSHDRILLEC